MLDQKIRQKNYSANDKTIYEVFLNIKNPLIINANSSNWNSIVNKDVKSNVNVDRYTTKIEGLTFAFDNKSDFDTFMQNNAKAENFEDIKKAYKEYLSDNLYISKVSEFIKHYDDLTLFDLVLYADNLDGSNSVWSTIENMLDNELSEEEIKKEVWGLLEDAYGFNESDNILVRPFDNKNYTAVTNTRSVVDYAIEQGKYDGVIIENVYDKSSNPDTIYVTIESSNQIKLTSNTNPTTDNDIRFSLDSDGKKLTQDQIEFFKDTKVLDEKGNLLKVYHGTNADFTVFDKKVAGQSNTVARIGFWFTPSESGAFNFANSVWYGEEKTKTIATYLDIKNPKIYTTTEVNEVEVKKINSKIADFREEENSLLNKYNYKEIGYLKSMRFFDLIHDKNLKFSDKYETTLTYQEYLEYKKSCG